MQPTVSRPWRLAGSYVLFSALWILFSDWLLLSLNLEQATLSTAQTYKGLAFVVASSLLILLLARRDQHIQRRLENSLRRNAEQLQQTQRDAGLGNWSFAGRFHWSAEALRLLERDAAPADSSLEEFLGWLHPADRNAVQRALLGLFEGGAPLQVNARLNHPNNRPAVWLLLRGKRDAAGKSQGSVQNISSQKRDEQALRESEQRFRQLFEQTPRIAVQGYDRQRRVIFWNQASTQLYGYEVADAMGRCLEELIVPPPMRAQVVNDINAWMIGGPAIAASELTLQHRDGSPVHVYSSHLLLRNARNQLELYCVDIDLGLQKKAHDQLEASEARYRELVEQLHEAIFLTDSRGRLTFLNPSWQSITGHSIGESLGRPLLDFIAAEQREALGQRIAAILARQDSGWLGETRLLEADGRTRWISLRLAAGEQHGLGLHGSLSDIQERRQTQALQEARNAVLDRMLAQRPLRETLNDMVLRLESINPEMQVSIMQLDKGRLRVLAAPSLPGSYASALDNLPAQSGLGSCSHAAASGELSIVEDIANHPNWASFRDQAALAGVRACWSLPFKNDIGEVLGVFGIYYRRVARPALEDIALVTEFTRLAGLAVRQHQRDAERLQSELRFRATFEQAAVGIAHLAPDGHWLRVNQRLCQMLGYSRDDLLELTFQDITHPDDLGSDLQQVERLLTGDIARYSLEKRYMRRDGSLLWANLSATLVRHTNGAPHYFISVVEDIGLRKQQELALQQAATVFESTQEAVVIVDANRRILTSNPAFTGITGLSPQQAIGRRLPLLPGNSVERTRYRTLWRKVQDSGHWQGELSSRREDGSPFPFWLTVSRVRGSDPQQPQYVLTFTDLSQYRDSQERLAHLVHFDTLTDLPNRLFANERLNHALEHAQRHDERVAVLFFDLDHFKTINEGLGHKIGDELLIAVARRLQQRLRNEDTLARLSSDEFLVVLENLQRPEEAASIARTLLALLERPLQMSNGREVYLGASIGISLYPDDGLASDELLRNAEAALHQAKQEGRNTYRFYTQGLTHQAHSRLALEAQLRQALKHNEFSLHYQPLLDAASGRTIGVEALLRWNSEQGLVSPARFIPLAEDTGLIVPIGTWVLREACRQMQFWRQQGLDLQTLAVNLSPRQFRQADLLQQVREALHDSGLPPACLELEITEGALMDNVEQARETLIALKSLGLKLAVDDFGTGYSSLAYLRRFPLDKLKVDQSFMQGVPEDQANLEIVATIVGLARNLKLRVLAEGVETPAQLQALRQLGCEQCQGYLFSRPLSAIQLVNWLRGDHQSAG
ncbi:EAL domain-containing protein [Pseudomonas sp. L-22-4S-12]|uniref:bifunctional diguanylate cyclase/phosphodiesterase n=1 Tax=Pseudomonas sp. L-22-4S-12 TaxID=2610893 RepID=UPI00132505C4|nr:EAL domain-containing protein [Pseudomonas sp. L-22-4S-12]MWV15659.1 EAL domain-containing protein [Pseudomonas sp. L-22-4S-12]